MKTTIYSQNRHFLWHHTVESREHGSLNDIMHYDHNMAVTYFLHASGSISVEGSSTLVKEGDILILNPHEFHRCVYDASPQHERISIQIHPSIAEGLSVSAKQLFSAFYDRPLGKGNVIPAKVVQELRIDQLLKEIEIPEKEDPDFDVLFQCRIIELMILLKKAVRLAVHEQLPKQENKTVSRAIEYINQHLAEELTTSSIAKQLFVDKSYFCRIFKQTTGATFNEYLTQKRIDFALQLINSGLSCTEACYKSGFGNYSSFYKYFKRYTANIPNNNKDKKNEQKKQAQAKNAHGKGAQGKSAPRKKSQSKSKQSQSKPNEA